jgi:hypothetical protein
MRAGGRGVFNARCPCCCARIASAPRWCAGIPAPDNQRTTDASTSCTLPARCLPRAPCSPGARRRHGAQQEQWCRGDGGNAAGGGAVARCYVCGLSRGNRGRGRGFAAQRAPQVRRGQTVPRDPALRGSCACAPTHGQQRVGCAAHGAARMGVCRRLTVDGMRTSLPWPPDSTSRLQTLAFLSTAPSSGERARSGRAGALEREGPQHA